jgi:hypothetical protein
MTPDKKVEKLIEVLNAGKTVYIQSCTRITKIALKDLRKFDAIGRPLFKTDGKSLFMSVGKRYDCIDYCKITME